MFLLTCQNRISHLKSASFVACLFHGEKSGNGIGMRSNIAVNAAEETKEKHEDH